MDCLNDNLLTEDLGDSSAEGRVAVSLCRKYPKHPLCRKGSEPSSSFIAPDGQEYIGTSSYVITPYLYNNLNIGDFERNRAIMNARGIQRDVYISPLNNGWRLQDEDTNFESFITDNVE